MTRGHGRAINQGAAVGDTHLRNTVRPALSSFLPTSSEQRRTRTLATLTAVAAAAGIAAVAATSSEEAAETPVAGASGADAADVTGTTGEGQHFALPEVDLAPRNEADSPIEAPIGDGDIERLSDQQELPSLSHDLAAVSEVTTTSVMAQEDEAGADAAPVYETVDGQLIDAERVFDFLDGRDAPLAAHADTIVAAGVEHDVDPRVVVAIAIAESNGAEMKPAGTHNAWGWGGSGPRGLRAWGSWEESIDDFTERLGALYDTDNVDWEFASTYCPPNTQWWYDTVHWAIGQI